MAIADFALKFGLVLKTLNLSRARLALTVGVAKSVVSRWASGVQVPSDHNLSLLTQAIGRHRPGFERPDWDLDAESFAQRLDVLGLQLAFPDKLSIAVLPFQNKSSDPEQEYFTDGITDDIITELSRFHALFVIARNSSFTYKGKSPDIRQVGRELGVRYVLEGSIHKSANRVRVFAKLVDTLTGNHIWTERYDRILEDIFAVQEEVAQAIVGTMAPRVELTERSRVVRRRPDSLTAYEIAQRAHAHAWEGQDKLDQKLIDLSVREAKEALAIDPNSVRALHALAMAHQQSLFLHSAADRKLSLQEASWACRRALELDGADSRSYALRAMGVWMSGEIDRYPEALADARRAHALNPSDTVALSYLACLEAGMGEHEHAIQLGHQVLRLNPRPIRSHMTYALLGFASFGARRYEEGVRWNLRALNDMSGMVSVYASLATCLVGAGEIDKAKSAFTEGWRLSPKFFKIRLEGQSPYGRPEDRERFRTFLRIAGGLEEASAADSVR